MAAPGRPAPLKPWETPSAQAGNPGPSPFAPSSAASTAAAIASSPAATTGISDKPGESHVRTLPVADGSEARNMPLRPWERSINQGYNNNTSYGSMYNRPYNSYGGQYGSSYGSSMYGGGMYGNSYGGGMYGNSYGGGMYGNSYGGGGGLSGNRYGYGGGAYGMPMGGPMGSYGGPYGAGNPMNPNNPDDPYGGPPRPPNFWQSMLTMLHGVMNFFGRLAILIDENTQAFHFFITALLQLCDRAGSLYGELARFVLRFLGVRTRSKARSVAGNRAALDGPSEPTKKANGGGGSGGAWENVWSASESPR